MVTVILFNWQSICYSSWSRASQGIEKNELEHQFAVCFSSFTRDTKQAWMAASEKKISCFPLRDQISLYYQFGNLFVKKKLELSVLYHNKKKKNRKKNLTTTTKSLFSLHSPYGIVTQKRFHVICCLSYVPGPSLHSTGHHYKTISYITLLVPLLGDLCIWFWTVISHSGGQSLISPPHSYSLLFLQILFYFDIVFTVIFTIEIALKVKCPSSLPLSVHKLTSFLPLSVANTHACLFLGHAQYN